LDILKLAKKVKKSGLKNKSEIKKKFKNELITLYNEFGWLSFNFCNSVEWDINHYVKVVVEKLDSDINRRIKYLENYEKEISFEFKNLCEKINLTQKEIHIFQFVRNLGYYKWVREYEFQKALYITKLVLDELGKRYGLTTIESKYLFPNEFREASANPEKIKQLTRKRLKNLLVLTYKNQGTIIIEGAKAKEKFSKMEFKKEMVGSNSNVLKGTPASSGKSKGVVKIVNEIKDLNKVKKGDILISQATSPDLLSGMKKASAIVTNEGGITCHAAIVSRELKIPCVIGTKIATKVLKDGDLVEVDANKGVVKIIKKSK